MILYIHIIIYIYILHISTGFSRRKKICAIAKFLWTPWLDKCPEDFKAHYTKISKRKIFFTKSSKITFFWCNYETCEIVLFMR